MADPIIEEVALAQRATDPRLEQNPDPAPEPVADPVPADPVDANADPVADPAPAEPVVKPKKTAEEVLKGRVGHLTKTLSAKDQAIAEVQARADAAQARAEAAEALLASSGTPPAGDPVVVPLRPATGSYTQADFDAAVAARAEVQEFNRKADEMYSAGAEKFDDWKDAVDTLVVSGFMNKDLLDAAMAVDGGTEVLHHLGTNLDEAERINALPPIRKAAEMAKLSQTLTAPRNVPVSAAPAPIKPIAGSPNPSVDLQRIADEGDMSGYIAARAKQGSRWAQGRNR